MSAGSVASGLISRGSSIGAKTLEILETARARLDEAEVEDAAKLAQLAEACKPVNPASASTSDSVTPILTIEDFEAALAHSASRGRLTV